MSTRPRKTLADYLVIGITPLLIMVLVASVSFFILELLYHGDYQGRMRWVIFWFVLGSVLVSRISIEQGYATASAYGLGLAIAVGMFIFRLFGPQLGALGLLAFIWWCTGKLTWDCTLIDEEKDASGQGLLQAAKLEQSSAAHSAPDQSGAAGKKRRRGATPHSPGMWVIYFSLVALPAFGVGQALIREGDERARLYGFQLLCAYVAAALALLLSTSFLGLRRYLRQRRLQMPGTVAITWVSMGAAIAGAVLFAALLLPRPDAAWSVPALIARAQQAAEEASRYALLGGEAGENDGRRIGEGKQPADPDPAAEKKKSGDAGKSADGKQGGKGKAKGAEKGASPEMSGQGNDQPQIKPGEKELKDRKGTMPPPPPEINETATFIGWLVKMAFYALLALGALWLLFAQRKRMAAVMRSLMRQLAEWWDKLFGRRPAALVPAQKLRRRPFADFTNPFLEGSASAMTAAEALAYTFEALEAWAVERDAARQPDQTPMEFAASLSARFPASGAELRDTARRYSVLVYAERDPPEHVKGELQRLWQFLETTRAT